VTAPQAEDQSLAELRKEVALDCDNRRFIRRLLEVSDIHLSPQSSSWPADCDFDQTAARAAMAR